MSLFCRHNRFTADCQICSKGTVLDPDRSATRRRSGGSGQSARRRASGEKAPAAPAFSGPHVATPVHVDDEGMRSLVRLERVPGGVRLGRWRGSALVSEAPVLAAGELLDLVERSGEALQARDAAKLTGALQTEPADGGDGGSGVSRGRSGDFKEELRVEPLDDGAVRVARWVQRPAVGWELQDAPPMLPAQRYAEALADALRRGALAAGDRQPS